MSKRKKKARKGKGKSRAMPARSLQKKPAIAASQSLLIPTGGEFFWARFERYNQLDPKQRADALKELGIEIYNNDVLGQLTKSHFVIPGGTRYECQQCGECCRYARKIATFAYEPCPFLGDDNLCAKHNMRYQVCKWFPFWVYPDREYGNLLVIKPYCTGYGRGELVDYEATVMRLLKLRQSASKDSDGAEVIHEVIYLPTRKEWTFPSKKNVDELINAISGKGMEAQPQNAMTTALQLEHARRYTSGLLSSANEANITVNENEIITDFNDALVSLFDRQRENFLGSRFPSLFTDPERASSILHKCFAVGKITGATLRLIYKSGKTIPTLCDAMTYRDSVDGMLRGILIALRPISESVFNEIEEARNYARGLIESSPDLMVTLGRDGIITDLNEAAARMTGCPRGELIGSKFRDYFTDPELADIGIRRVFAHGEARDYELELQNRSGEAIPVSFNATIYRGVDNAVIGMFGVARDIRNMRRTLGNLEEAHNYARGLIESSLDLMVTLNHDGIITDVNEAAARMTGCSRRELIGSKFRDYFTDPEQADIDIRRVFEEGHARDCGLELQSRTGGVVSVSINAAEYRNVDGEVQGMFAIAREMRHSSMSCV